MKSVGLFPILLFWPVRDFERPRDRYFSRHIPQLFSTTTIRGFWAQIQINDKHQRSIKNVWEKLCKSIHLWEQKSNQIKSIKICLKRWQSMKISWNIFFAPFYFHGRRAPGLGLVIFPNTLCIQWQNRINFSMYCNQQKLTSFAFKIEQSISLNTFLLSFLDEFLASRFPNQSWYLGLAEEAEQTRQSEIRRQTGTFSSTTQLGRGGDEK